MFGHFNHNLIGVHNPCFNVEEMFMNEFFCNIFLIALMRDNVKCVIITRFP